ncbi:hypothetical protein AB7D55_003492 [Vibrio mimicus]
MYKVEKCGDEFWCILDVQTTMPPLLSFRWLESQLKENALIAGKQITNITALPPFIIATEETNRKKTYCCQTLWRGV